MNRSETEQILAILHVAYPRMYSGFKDADYDTVINLWQEMFSEEPYQVVNVALKAVIKRQTQFPPDIAMIQSEIDNMRSMARGDPSDAELWGLLKKAAENSTYGAEEEFNKLPRVLQIYLGSPSELRAMGAIEPEVLATVTKGQFYKQLPVLKERVKAPALSPAISELLKLPKPEVPRELTPGEINARKNEIARALS